MAKEKKPSGLEDVVVCEQNICYIDGKRGQLVYRGYDIDDLCENSTFEEVAYLLWNGNLPDAKRTQRISARLVASDVFAGCNFRFAARIAQKHRPDARSGNRRFGLRRVRSAGRRHFARSQPRQSDSPDRAIAVADHRLASHQSGSEADCRPTAPKASLITFSKR